MKRERPRPWRHRLMEMMGPKHDRLLTVLKTAQRESDKQLCWFGVLLCFCSLFFLFHILSFHPKPLWMYPGLEFTILSYHWQGTGTDPSEQTGTEPSGRFPEAPD